MSATKTLLSKVDDLLRPRDALCLESPGQVQDLLYPPVASRAVLLGPSPAGRPKISRVNSPTFQPCPEKADRRNRAGTIIHTAASSGRKGAGHRVTLLRPACNRQSARSPALLHPAGRLQRHSQPPDSRHAPARLRLPEETIAYRRTRGTFEDRSTLEAEGASWRLETTPILM